MTVLFWTNRKAARTEGCASFLLKKIEMKKHLHAKNPKLLKLTDAILDDIIKTIDKKKPVKFEIVMGTENITAEIGIIHLC